MPLDRYVQRLGAALDGYDADEVNAIFDHLFGSLPLDTVLAEVVIPYLHDLGERWDSRTATVAQEHFASNLLRTRLAVLARGWESGDGPLALLACAPGEQHDLPLMIFGLALRTHGWRIVYLGADTPGESVADAAREIDPALVVVSSVLRSRFRAAADALAAIAGTRPLAVAGRGASESLAEALGCTWLTGGPVAAADRIAAERRAA